MTKSDYYRNLPEKRMGSGMLFFNALYRQTTNNPSPPYLIGIEVQAEPSAALSQIFRLKFAVAFIVITHIDTLHKSFAIVDFIG